MCDPRAAAILILICMVGAGAFAQDVTAPILTSASAELELTTNADPARILVDATANEPSRFEVTGRYTSSYPQFVEPVTEYYAYKTAAVGDHAATSIDLALSVANLELLVGPRCYHSDTLTVWVEAIDAAGNRSQPTEILSTVLEMPFGTVPQGQGDGYGRTSIHIGGSAPYSGTVDEWSTADVIVCAPAHIWGNSDATQHGYDHWIERARELPGSRNIAVIGFTSGTALWNNDDIPVAQRLYQFFDTLYQSAQATAHADTNILAHIVDGSLAVVDHPSYEIGSRLVNLFSPVARDTLAWFFVNEFNHADNRQPNVGLMFDVWEYYSDFPIVVDGQRQFSPLYLDRDLDGIPMAEDPDAQAQARQSRLTFLRGLRGRLYASAANPDVGRHFLLGGNSVSARCDAEMAALLDHIFVEDYQCPSGCSTGMGDRIWHRALDPEFVRDVFPSFCDPEAIGIPYPAGFSSSFPSVTAAMRDSAGGPFLTPESQGSCSGISMDPVINESFCLLLDDTYPIWIAVEDPEDDRRYSGPERRGWRDLHDLGLAVGESSLDILPSGSHRWRRQYQFGEVEVVLADTTVFDCERGDLIEYRVEIGGEDVRRHPYFGDPSIDAFIVAAWDSAGIGGTIRVDLVALGSEPSYWDRSLRIGLNGLWRVASTTSELTQDLAGYWDTNIPPISGSLWVRVRARDQAGLVSDWEEFEIELDRFEDSGVYIQETIIDGTTYGLHGADGDYQVLRRGDSPPDAAPPHFLELVGIVEAGFVPQRILWTSNQGGSGEGTVGDPWMISNIPLYRGINVITVICIDAAGGRRLGAVTLDWNYPGRPGRSSR